MADAKINQEQENKIVALETRIDALESRNVFQDDLVEQLSQELAIHQVQMADLKQQLTLMASRLKDASATQSTVQEIEPPPPHF